MEEMIQILNEYYPIKFDRIELIRDMGSTSYTVFSGNNKFFMRVIKPAFFYTAVIGADVQVYLQNQGFQVPQILLTNKRLPYVKDEEMLLILYEFIEGSDSDSQQDAEAIGSLVGRLHQAMKTYPGKLVERDKHFYQPWQEDPHLLAFLAHVVRAKVGDELPAPQMRRFFEQITSYIVEEVVQ